jgi:AraC family transcriptional regulator
MLNPAVAAMAKLPEAAGDIIQFPRAAMPYGPSLCQPIGGVSNSRLIGPSVRIHPGETAKRQAAMWRGLSGEVVQMPSGQAFETSCHASFHLLIAYQRATRRDGVTVVEGLPRSVLRDFSQKLTFVPAGHFFRECQTPAVAMRAIFLFIDPTGPLLDAEVGFNQAIFKPRLFFEDPILFATARKLGALIEAGDSYNRFYAEALGNVLAHELIRLDAVMTPIDCPTRGGLAGWQQKRVADYIDGNLSNRVSLTTLAGLAELSHYHFSRAFKQSFGLPPLRYHAQRRIERAKSLLAGARQSITEIALEIGFSDASSFARVFHKFTGRTPSEYRRSVI